MNATEPLENPTYAKLMSHVEHTVEIALYGKTGEEPVNASVECINCDEVLISEDRYSEEPE